MLLKLSFFVIANSICNVNVQSLNAHRKDIAGDPILPLADYYLFLSETWMRFPITLLVSDFECVSSCNFSSGTAHSVGGSAIFKRINSSSLFTLIELVIDIEDSKNDICMGIINTNNVNIVVGSVYVHPNTGCDISA